MSELSELNVSALRALAVGDAADIAFGGAAVPVDYDADKDEFIVHVRPLETDRVRLVVGARHVRSKDHWRMPATRAQAAALSGVFGGRLEPTEAANWHVTDLFTNKPWTWDLGEHLFDFQREGVEYLLTAGSALLGDEMGTGKTIQTIEWMRLNSGSYQANHLVICPNSMKYKWAEEIEKWWPQATPVVIDGTAPKRRKQIESLSQPVFPVAIINYQSLRSHTALQPWGGKALTEKQKVSGEFNEINWRCVAVDEAHRIKDPGAQQTMAVKKMGVQAQHRLALTGTPVLNSPDDVWSIMNFVAPREYGSRNQFRNRYCRMQSAWHGGFENLGLRPETRSEFDQFFIPRFIRRTKVEVLPDLPEKFEIDYRVLPMSPKQAQVYKALSDDMMVSIDDELLTVENPLDLTLRLRQIACAMPVVNDEGKVTALQTPSNKLDALSDIVDGSDEPLVVYAESRKFIELVAEHFRAKGLRVGMITGVQGPKERERHVVAFQDGKLDLILGTLGAGAEGITLTRASTIVLAQQSWAHGTNAQAIDRLHRIGQTRGVHPIVLISEGTIDHAVAYADVNKEMRLQELVRDPGWMKAAIKGEVR